jgi:hypothetical protein
MAEREDIKDRVRRINPQAEVILQEFMQTAGNIMVFTEDMTTEEKEMVVFESLIKEGISIEEAERLTPIRLKEAEFIFNML